METAKKLEKFSEVLEKIGHIWVFVEIVKTIIELVELVTGLHSGWWFEIHEVMEVIALTYGEVMSIILVHLLFEFGSLLMEGLAKLIEKK